MKPICHHFDSPSLLRACVTSLVELSDLSMTSLKQKTQLYFSVTDPKVNLLN